VTGLNVKVSVFVLGLFVFIACILGCKTNYRPVSVLPAISKLFERTIFDQLSSFFENHFHPFLSAFRSGHGCQTALLKFNVVQRHDQNST
jgi:hypothetical protein